MKIIKLTATNIRPTIDKIRKRQEKDLRTIERKVESILQDVRLRGDKALFELSYKFDKFQLNKNNLKVSQQEISASEKAISPKAKAAIKKAIKRVQDYQKKKMPKSYKYKDEFGNVLGWNITPIDRVGIYVPGGTASYPSSLIMTATLAKVAGSKDLVVATPPSNSGLNPAILYTAHLLGIKEIFQIGGAQAVAALAYGTKSIKPVHKIVGPGNIYVATAKKKVFGKVSIDMIAGPSEVLVIADASAKPNFVAADLIAQAEHDINASAICVTNSVKLAKSVLSEINAQAKLLPRRNIISKSLKRNGSIYLMNSLKDCIGFSNIFAPEHLEIFTKNTDEVCRKIINAGSIFAGENSGEAIGDYIAGPSHVLPTAGSAIFSSPLSALDFIKYSSYTKISKLGVNLLGKYAIDLAKEESLDGHANSISMRIDQGVKNGK